MLKQEYRLRKQKDFALVLKSTNTSGTKNILMKALSNNSDFSRFGFIISKKVDKRAVIRNRIKRQLSEIIRLQCDRIKPGFDVIILVKKPILEIDYKQMEKEIIYCLNKLKLL